MVRSFLLLLIARLTNNELDVDMPPRTPARKHDEESVASSNKRDGSPVLKKAPVTLQLRSESL